MSMNFADALDLAMTERSSVADTQRIGMPCLDRSNHSARVHKLTRERTTRSEPETHHYETSLRVAAATGALAAALSACRAAPAPVAPDSTHFEIIQNPTLSKQALSCYRNLEHLRSEAASLISYADWMDVASVFGALLGGTLTVVEANREEPSRPLLIGGGIVALTPGVFQGLKNLHDSPTQSLVRFSRAKDHFFAAEKYLSLKPAMNEADRLVFRYVYDRFADCASTDTGPVPDLASAAKQYELDAESESDFNAAVQGGK